MTERSNKAKRSRFRVLILLCALVGFFLSSGVNLSNLTLSSESAAPNGVGLNARLSLNDSAIVRVEKRISTIESKRYRRQLQSAPPSARSGLALAYARDRWSSAFRCEPGCSIAAISPPADRAPPVIAL